MREIRPSGLTRGEAAELPPLSYSPGPACVSYQVDQVGGENTEAMRQADFLTYFRDALIRIPI